MITVFYDGSCGLCSKEIAHYRKIANDVDFRWVDITTDQAVLDKRNISYVAALKTLHIEDDNGTIKTGVDSFITIWSHLPRWWVLAKIIALPGIKSCADFAYNKFAEKRFEKLDHCSSETYSAQRHD